MLQGIVAAIGLLLALAIIPWQRGADAAPASFAGIGVTNDGLGYVLAGDTGETYAFGSVPYHGNPTGFEGAITDVSVTADGQGYVEISTAGQVYAFGSVQHRDNVSGADPMVGVSVTADGQGYVAVSESGQVYAFGTAQYFENPTGFSEPIVDIAVTDDGGGHAVVSAAGEVYAYGNVQYRDNAPADADPIVAVSVTSDGQGYALVSNTGQVYAFGSAQYHDNPSGFDNGVVGIDVSGDGGGYAVMSGAGQVYAYGGVQYFGNGDWAELYGTPNDNPHPEASSRAPDPTDRTQFVNDEIDRLTDEPNCSTSAYRDYEDETSNHNTGNALDCTISDRIGSDPSAEQRIHGWAFANWLREHAGTLDVSYVIWDDTIWNTRYADQGWREYDPDGDGRDDEGVTDGHYDHVHISIKNPFGD